MGKQELGFFMDTGKDDKIVSKSLNSQAQKIITEALEIESESALDAGKLSFVSLNFVQTILPHSRIDGMRYEKINGNYSLNITNVQGGNLPYGSISRLILSWIVTEAIKTQSSEIFIGNNLSQFMKKVGVPITGYYIKQFKEQSIALFTSVISVEYNGDGEKKGANILIASNYSFWWDDETEQKSLFESHIKLSDEFYDLIVRHHVPVDLRAISALKKSSLAVDIYSWLTYRYSKVTKRTFVPWEALHFQFGMGFKDNASGRQSFKRSFNKALEKIKILYPQAIFMSINDGLILFPSPTHVPSRENMDLLDDHA